MNGLAKPQSVRYFKFALPPSTVPIAEPRPGRWIVGTGLRETTMIYHHRSGALAMLTATKRVASNRCWRLKRPV